ncbi:hypothetical protein V500_08809 [Pseudogymnoascus sp. VKM F-4518 (FW-2643)]|nr:hypothetical protein V500_08809 [Pseudogymnoascus sp. VKM F-4518 (FW-2643)]
MADVEKAIDASPTPIAGVLQMSMVLRDSALLQTSYDDWRDVQACKVKGTWNLHNALSGGKLDFFILLASLAGAVGHPGQANYASANSFLDSFVQYRHGLGLPCSAIDLGGMEGIGCLSDKPVKLLVYRPSGLNMLQEQQLMDAIELGIRYSLPADNMRPTSSHSAFTNMSHFAVGMNSTKPISDPMNRVIFKGDPRISVYNNIVFADQKNVSESKEEGVRELLREVEANPELLREPDTVNRASWEIGRTLFGFLLLPEENLDVSMSLTSIGVDSLVSIEIRNWWRRTLGMDIMVLEVLSDGTIEGLGKLIVLSLQKKYGIEGEGGDDTKESESAN